MSNLLDDVTLGLDCPSCGHENPRTIGWIKAHDSYTCEECGEIVFLFDNGPLPMINEAETYVEGRVERGRASVCVSVN